MGFLAVFAARKYLIRLRNLAVHRCRFEACICYETELPLAAVALWVPPDCLNATVPDAHRSAYFRLFGRGQRYPLILPVRPVANEPGATRLSFSRYVRRNRAVAARLSTGRSGFRHSQSYRDVFGEKSGAGVFVCHAAGDFHRRVHATGSRTEPGMAIPE